MSRGGNGPGGTTSVNATIADAASHAVVLIEPANRVLISNYSNNLLYLSLYGPASSNNYAIPPTSTFTYDGPAITGLFLNANGNSINYGVFAV